MTLWPLGFTYEERCVIFLDGVSRTQSYESSDTPSLFAICDDEAVCVCVCVCVCVWAVQVRELRAQLGEVEADGQAKAAAIAQLDKDLTLTRSQLAEACSEKERLALKITELERVQVPPSESNKHAHKNTKWCSKLRTCDGVQDTKQSRSCILDKSIYIRSAVSMKQNR